MLHSGGKKEKGNVELANHFAELAQYAHLYIDLNKWPMLNPLYWPDLEFWNNTLTPTWHSCVSLTIIWPHVSTHMAFWTLLWLPKDSQQLLV